MGTMGLSANFMAYLTNVFHMKLVDASNVFNLWLGLSNLAPLLGAIISDAYVGRFKTIAYASFFSLLVRFLPLSSILSSTITLQLKTNSWVTITSDD